MKQIRAWSSRKLWVNRTDEVSAEGSGLIPTARRDTARFRLAGNASRNPTHSPECIINTSPVIWWSIGEQQVQVIHGCMLDEERIFFFLKSRSSWFHLRCIFTVQQFLHSCLNTSEAHHIDNLWPTLPVHGHQLQEEKQKTTFIARF